MGLYMLMHGGSDALGAAQWDFSTNANACGPCPQAVQALQVADRSRYPDPAYTDLRALLAAWHGVQAQQVVVAASASEFIARISHYAARRALGGGGRQVLLPAHSYGDYAHAARVAGLECVVSAAQPAAALALRWACEPSSPLGRVDAALAGWVLPSPDHTLRVLDCAYAPLRLDGHNFVSLERAWQLWTPNKALGLTGVRAAYAIAPVQALEQVWELQQWAPSWPLGADGVALLTAWVGPDVQRWLAQSLHTLADWKAQQVALCQDLGWQVLPGSLANYFCARLPEEFGGAPEAMTAVLAGLRGQGIKLRDCASFGLPGCVRLGVLAPPAQQALGRAWAQLGGRA